MTPEAKARERIDQKLAQAGWVVQDLKQLNLGAAIGVAVREYPTDTGPADYVLFVNREAVGVIEAKRDEAGENITATEAQTNRYASATLKWRKDKAPLPFLFESTGQIIRFTDGRDPAPRSREIFYFFKPETLEQWLAQSDTLRRRLADKMPALPERNLRDCQVSAVTGLEKSLALNKPRALVHMATGAGKTFTAITSVYRLLKFGGAKRILFLVDTRNLGKQAHQEFMAYTPPDDGRKFTELYNVQRLSSSSIDPHAQVCISTIQRMYSVLSGEPIDESAEDVSLNELQQTEKQAKRVTYNPAIPIETFDFIIIDECHRSIYNLWKQVLDYFDAFLIGLTATPDKRTFGFFNENIVAEYTYEQSVADGVNVGYDVYEIETKITKAGETLQAREWVDHRDRQTRKKRWAETEEDNAYTAKELDRSVVNTSQIRQVIQAMKTAVETQIFPNRKETPKTLIFAKTDSHADDIIQSVREVYGEGNAFCKKVTYKAEEDTDSILSAFRNDYNPRIAVTVDMIATWRQRWQRFVMWRRACLPQTFDKGGLVSDIKLFRMIDGKTTELEGDASGLEKPLQTLIENNLESLLGIRFLATEYSTGKTHAGRIDSLGLDENHCPVILEYKRSVGENVINQGLFYLDWLMDHKGEFELLVMRKLGADSQSGHWGTGDLELGIASGADLDTIKPLIQMAYEGRRA